MKPCSGETSTWAERLMPPPLLEKVTVAMTVFWRRRFSLEKWSSLNKKDTSVSCSRKRRRQKIKVWLMVKVNLDKVLICLPLVKCTGRLKKEVAWPMVNSSRVALLESLESKSKVLFSPRCNRDGKRTVWQLGMIRWGRILVKSGFINWDVFYQTLLRQKSAEVSTWKVAIIFKCRVVDFFFFIIMMIFVTSVCYIDASLANYYLFGVHPTVARIVLPWCRKVCTFAFFSVLVKIEHCSHTDKAHTRWSQDHLRRRVNAE